jgi:hypothetical protein
MNLCRSFCTLGYLFVCIFCQLKATSRAELTLVFKDRASLHSGETATISAKLSELSAVFALDSRIAALVYDQTLVETSPGHWRIDNSLARP